MTEETEIRIPFGDLTRISFECRTCSAEITVDITKEKHVKVETGILSCPICGAAFDSQLAGAFTDFFNSREKVKNSKHRVCFRIKQDG